jgi:transposase
VLRSFIASCQRVNVEPFAWFKDVLARIPNHPINRITELLPHSWASAQA